MAYFQNKVGTCWWFYFNGPFDPKDWSRYLADSRRAYNTCAAGDLLLTIPYAYGAPPAAERKALAEAIGTEGARRLSHHAFLTDSSLLMAVNTAIGWISKKPWTERSFTDPSDAFRWLSQASTGLTPRVIAADIVRVVPAAHSWAKIAALAL